MRLVLLCLLLQAAPPDAGAADSGSALAVGTDGGSDAGLDAGPIATWRAYAGLFAFDDAGTTDVVTVSVGASVEVRFPRTSFSSTCDDRELFTIVGLVDSYRITGLKPGQTHCGFWFEKRPWPNRYVEVNVVP
jgi:hypothetical protein